MNYSQRLKSIKSKLAPYQKIWNDEVLNSYPHSLNNYPENWIETLLPLSQKDLWLFDGKKEYQSIEKSELYYLIQEINELIRLPKSKQQEKKILPEWAFVKVGEKKKHEILSLLPYLNELREHPLIIDIGGGIGHLSRIIAHYCAKEALCLEQDANLIKIGKKRVAKYPPPADASPINFQQIIFGKEKTDGLFNQNTFSIGLHTCGPLAVEHLRSAVRNKERGLLNFGCCYPRITESADLNISSIAIANPLEINEFGLTLATRSHALSSFEEYQLKERVKNYRYHLHLFCYLKRDIHQFISVGNSPRRLYRESFATYALPNLKKLDLTASEKELNLFYSDKKINELVQKLYRANLIRWQFGRLIEHYILTDRALFLEENGYIVSMKEYFDESISPRNIGLSAKRACHST